MRSIRFLIAVAAFLFSAVAGYADEVKPETAPSVIPDTKHEVTSDAAQTTVITQGTQHEETAQVAGEKRFVAVVGPDGVQQVELAGGEYYFEPNHIVLKVNVPAEFKVRKAKDASWFIPHDIVVKAPEAGIDFKVDLSKELQTVKFTPTKAGKYSMSCDEKPLFFKSHKEKGMVGVIEVVE
jgi:plastocyanin